MREAGGDEETEGGREGERVEWNLFLCLSKNGSEKSTVPNFSLVACLEKISQRPLSFRHQESESESLPTPSLQYLFPVPSREYVYIEC